MASLHILRKIFVSAYESYLLVTLIYFDYLRFVVDSGSSESNNDSNCDLESTDSKWIDISDLIKERVGVESRGSQEFQTTGQKQYLGKSDGPLWKIFKSHRNQLLLCTLNGNLLMPR